VDCIHSAQDKVQWWDLVHTVMKLGNSWPGERLLAPTRTLSAPLSLLVVKHGWYPKQTEVSVLVFQAHVSQNICTPMSEHIQSTPTSVHWTNLTLPEKKDYMNCPLSNSFLLFPFIPSYAVYPKVSGLSNNEIYAYNNKHSMRSNTKGYGGKTQEWNSHRVQTGSGARPSSYPMGTKGSPAGKAAGAWSWPLTSI
jgi:hypothetical protein